MDRVAYAQRVAARLNDLRSTVDARTLPEPATLAMARALAPRKQKEQELLDRIAHLSSRVAALAALAATVDFETEQRNVDRELSEIETLSMAL